MRALIIQHDHVCPPGPVAERLTERGIETVLHPVVPRDQFSTPGVSTTFPPVQDVDLARELSRPPTSR